MNKPVDIKSLASLYRSYSELLPECKKLNGSELLAEFKSFYEKNMCAYKINTSQLGDALVDAVDYLAASFFAEVPEFTPHFWGKIKNESLLERFILNGAKNWKHAVDGGVFICSNYDIALLAGGEKFAKAWENNEIEIDLFDLQTEIFKKAFLIFARICRNFAELYDYQTDFDK